MASGEKAKDLIDFLESEIISSEDDVPGEPKIDSDEIDQLVGGEKKTSLGLNGAASLKNDQRDFISDTVPGLEESSDKEQQEDFFSETFDEDGEEINLSVDELDEIIEDAANISEESSEAPETLPINLKEDFDSEETAVSEPPSEEFSHAPLDDVFSETLEGGEEIALSGDELDDILKDVGESPEESPEAAETVEEVSRPEETQTGDEPSEEESPDSEETVTSEPLAKEASYALLDDVFSETPEGGEEIALSGGELDDILKDVGESPEESPEAAETVEEVSRPEETQTGGEPSEEESPDSEETATRPLPESLAEEASEIPSDEVFSETSEKVEKTALSSDELDDILEDVAEVIEESSEAPDTAGVSEGSPETPGEVFRSEETKADGEPSGEESLGSEETLASQRILRRWSEDEESPDSGETSASEPREKESNTDLSRKSQEPIPDLKDTDDPATEEYEESQADDFFSETFRSDDEEKLLLNDEENEPVEDIQPESDPAGDSLGETMPDLHEMRPELSINEPQGDQEESTAEAKNRIQLSEELSSQELDKGEIKKIVSYLDDLLGELPDDVIKKFSQSEYFTLYKKVIQQLGI